jgi:hypothetical protein
LKWRSTATQKAALFSGCFSVIFALDSVISEDKVGLIERQGAGRVLSAFLGLGGRKRKNKPQLLKIFQLSSA